MAARSAPLASATSRPRVASTAPVPAAPPMAADDAADHRADAGAGSDLRGVLTLGGFSLERNRVGAHRFAGAIDVGLREPKRKARASLHASGAGDVNHGAVKDRTGRKRRRAVDHHPLAEARPDRCLNRGGLR